MTPAARPLPEQLQQIQDPQLTVPGLRLSNPLRPDYDGPYPYQKIDAAYMCL